jgi:cell division protein FtsX
MNIFNNKKQDNTVQRLRESSWHRLSRDPFVDWIFILAIAITVVALSIVVAVWKYVDIGIITTTSDNSQSLEIRKVIDEGELKNFQDKLSLRIENTKNIQNGQYTKLADPF